MHISVGKLLSKLQSLLWKNAFCPFTYLSMGVFATSHVCFKHTSNTVYKQNKNVLCGLTTHLECAMHVFLDLPKNDLLALDAFYLCTAEMTACKTILAH